MGKGCKKNLRARGCNSGIFVVFIHMFFSPAGTFLSGFFFSWFMFWVPKTLAQQQSGRADVLTDVGVCCVSRAAVSMVQLPPCPPRSLCAAPMWTFQPPPLWGPCPLIQSPPTLYCSCVWRFVLEGLFPLFRYVGRNLSVHAQPQPHTHAHALRRHKQQNYCLRPSHVAALIFTPRTIPTRPASGCVYWPF